MIFCYGVFWKSGHPKFYAPVVEKMKEANEKAFLTREDFDRFTWLLTEKLVESKPKFHQAEVYVHISKPNDGCIYLKSGKLDDNICRLQFCEVKEVLEYDKEADAFYDVSERLEG